MTAHIGYSFCYDIAVWRQFAMRGVEDAAPYEGREFDMPQTIRRGLLRITL
jgi:hypothetical protein